MDLFPYIPLPIRDKNNNIVQIFKPMVVVRLCFKHKLSPYPFSCLLDSGSDMNLFPSCFAQNIGIKLEDGEEIKIRGIGDIEIKAYRHKVQLYLDKKHFETTIDFSNYQQFALLGRNGFFNHFNQVIFKEKEKIVELH